MVLYSSDPLGTAIELIDNIGRIDVIVTGISVMLGKKALLKVTRKIS